MTSPAPSGNGSKLWIIALVVVLVAGVAAVVISRGGDDDAAPSEQVSSDTCTSDGGALPAYDGSADIDPAVCQTIPTVTGTGFDGEEIKIAPNGKAKILLFVAHWCPHCQREVPRLVEHFAERPMPEDVELITVSTNVQPSAENYPPQEWLESEGWTAPVIADDDANTIGTTYGLSSFPYFVAVDADGKVVARASGELTTDQFDDLVAQAQGE